MEANTVKTKKCLVMIHSWCSLRPKLEKDGGFKFLELLSTKKKLNLSDASLSFHFLSEKYPAYG